MFNWSTLPGRHVQFAGTTAQTVTMTAGAIVWLIAIRATNAAAATLTIFGGPAITIPQADTATTIFFFEHMLVQATAASNAIVIGGTPSMFYISAVLPGNGN